MELAKDDRLTGRRGDVDGVDSGPWTARLVVVVVAAAASGQGERGEERERAGRAPVSTRSGR